MKVLGDTWASSQHEKSNLVVELLSFKKISSLEVVGKKGEQSSCAGCQELRLCTSSTVGKGIFSSLELSLVPRTGQVLCGGSDQHEGAAAETPVSVTGEGNGAGKAQRGLGQES